MRIRLLEKDIQIGVADGNVAVSTRAVKEYLDYLDQDVSFDRKQKSVSLTDPMSQ
jgi:hypothetical protein